MNMSLVFTDNPPHATPTPYKFLNLSCKEHVVTNFDVQDLHLCFKEGNCVSDNDEHDTVMILKRIPHYWSFVLNKQLMRWFETPQFSYDVTVMDDNDKISFWRVS